jgi:hypothetical protein
VQAWSFDFDGANLGFADELPDGAEHWIGLLVSGTDWVLVCYHCGCVVSWMLVWIALVGDFFTCAASHRKEAVSLS